ncbi:hypothetical protein AX16_010776 [Volvariella volvacea WC 439]|nr:hypothetical protein AX16_010776 [Volvariella volvacea WC 439]
MYRVFIGAPSANDIRNDPQSYRWLSVSSIPPPSSQAVVLPPATIEAASRRISFAYRSVIFDEDDEDDLYAHELRMDEDSFVAKEQTTVVSWPASTAAELVKGDTTSISRLDPSKSTVFTQDTHEEESPFQNYSYSDASSIVHFPTFHFNLHSLTSVSAILQSNVKASRKVNVVMAVLEVEGPDSIRIKKGPDAGREVAILKMILGDEDGNVGKLTAWREVAESWGGSLINQPSAKRGDVIHFQGKRPSSHLP